MSGFIPCATAAVRTNVLNVEPVWRWPCVARLYWFFFLPGVRAAIARMAPLPGLIDTSAAAGSVVSGSVSRITRLAMRWSRRSIVV